MIYMKKKRYGYDFKKEENDENETEFNLMNIPKPETEDPTFIQFLLNRIIKNNK